MANIMEIRVEQRKRLFQLLKLKKVYCAYNSDVIDDMIITTEAEMEAEDVAYVEKMIAQLPNK